MNTENSTYNQYGITFLPVLIKLVREDRAGPHAVTAFLHSAQADLDMEQELEEIRRLRVTRRSNSRRERFQATKYFDYGRRAQKSVRLALKALEDYLQEPEDIHLEQALLQFETGERFRRNQLCLRMHLLPMVCERISRAS